MVYVYSTTNYVLCPCNNGYPNEPQFYIYMHNTCLISIHAEWEGSARNTARPHKKAHINLSVAKPVVPRTNRYTNNGKKSNLALRLESDIRLSYFNLVIILSNVNCYFYHCHNLSDFNNVQNDRTIGKQYHFFNLTIYNKYIKAVTFY